MNVPPKEFLRVPVEALRRLTEDLFVRAGTPGPQAQIIAELLVDTDLRGVFSHGTTCTPRYVRGMLEGQINPAPQVRVVRDEPVTAVIDGDGGLGHIATHHATEMVITKARQQGLGAVGGRPHAHFGGAGKYTRLIIRQDCVGFCVSGHTMGPYHVEHAVWNPLGNPPLSFAFPADQEAPLVLDMGTSLFEPEHFPGVFQQAPAAFFKSLGLVGVAHFLAGILAGLMAEECRPGTRTWAGAGYGAFVLALDIGRFVEVRAFKQEADRAQRALHGLPPLPGYGRYDLPGGPEHEREQEYRALGVPLGREHREGLEETAARLGVSVPWR
ncbi:MAG: Ldh family oxidoreductase [Candidatus Latescibacterota bacterium]